MDMQNCLTQISDVIGEIHFLLESLHVPGPFSRSRAYQFRKAIPNTRVFQFRDVIKCYYVVDVSTGYGQDLYNDLCSKRLVLNRLRKELDKL